MLIRVQAKPAGSGNNRISGVRLRWGMFRQGKEKIPARAIWPFPVKYFIVCKITNKACPLLAFSYNGYNLKVRGIAASLECGGQRVMCAGSIWLPSV